MRPAWTAQRDDRWVGARHATEAAELCRREGGRIFLTLGSGEAVEVAEVIGARAVVPIHQEGWSHFSHAPERLRAAFEQAGLADRLVEVEPGGMVTV